VSDDFDDEDPEVRHDRMLREESMRDTSRTRGKGIYDWKPPVFVCHWQCRGKCGAMVGITQDTIDHLEQFNRYLERRGEPPIDTTKTVFCDACIKYGKSLQGDNNRNRVDALAELIRELKNSIAPDRERDLIERIRKAGHPDVDALVQVLTEKRAKGVGRKAQPER